MSTDELIKRLAWGSGITIALAAIVIYATSSGPTVRPIAATRPPAKAVVEKVNVEVVQTPVADTAPTPSPAASNTKKLKTIFE